MKRANPTCEISASASDRLGTVAQKGHSKRRTVPTSDFSEIYKLYRQRVFLWCLRIARNAEDAEDLTQDTFLHLFRKIDTFRGESAFSTWLYRLTTNIALMRLRRKGPQQISLDGMGDSEYGTVKPHPELRALDRILAGSIARADLDRALLHVPLGFRKAVLLHDGEQYTHGEIAQLTGWAIGTSKSQLHKARRRLRKLLSENWECVGGTCGRGAAQNQGAPGAV